MYNLDNNPTFKTLHEYPGKDEDTRGAATMNLGSKKMPVVVDIDADNDNMSRVAGMTRVSKDTLPGM